MDTRVEDLINYTYASINAKIKNGHLLSRRDFQVMKQSYDFVNEFCSNSENPGEIRMLQWIKETLIYVGGIAFIRGFQGVSVFETEILFHDYQKFLVDIGLGASWESTKNHLGASVVNE